MMNDADLKFPIVRDAEGSELRLTHGNYIKLLESPDRTVRRDAFKGMYSVYGQFKNTFASILDTAVKWMPVCTSSNPRWKPPCLRMPFP